MKAIQPPCLDTITSCYFHSYCTAVQQLADIMSLLSQHTYTKESSRKGYNKNSLSLVCHLLLMWGGEWPIHVWMWVQLICTCKIATSLIWRLNSRKCSDSQSAEAFQWQTKEESYLLAPACRANLISWNMIDIDKAVVHKCQSFF